MKIENIKVYGWENAITEMRKSIGDPQVMYSTIMYDISGHISVDLCDKDLALIKTIGKDFFDLIYVFANINMPISWWKDSQSPISNILYNILSKGELTKKDFSPYEDFEALNSVIDFINTLLIKIREIKSLPQPERDANEIKKLYNIIIDILPSCYLYEKVICINYNTLLSILKTDRDSFRNEWKFFKDIMFNTVPYLEEIYKGEQNEN